MPSTTEFGGQHAKANDAKHESRHSSSECRRGNIRRMRCMSDGQIGDQPGQKRAALADELADSAAGNVYSTTEVWTN